MSSKMSKPQLVRRRTIEYDRSLLVPMMKRLGASDDDPQDASRGGSVIERRGSGTRLAEVPPLTKCFRSALGSAAFRRTVLRDESYRALLPPDSSSPSNGHRETAAGNVSPADVERMVDSISETLMDREGGYGSAGTYRHYCKDVKFEPQGCTWHATVVLHRVEGDDKDEERSALAALQAEGKHVFKIRIVCHAEEPPARPKGEGGGGRKAGVNRPSLADGPTGRPSLADGPLGRPSLADGRPGLTRGSPDSNGGDDEGGEEPEDDDEDGVHYVVEMDLLPDEDDDGCADGSSLMVDFPGIKPGIVRRSSSGGGGDQERHQIIKKVFDEVALDVKKAIVRCEFPEFPEGCKGRPFREVYQLNARLKSGSFATVCRGTHRATGRKVAIKCVLRKDLPPNDDAAVFDEVAILASLRHRYICPLIDFFDEKECYFLVMELMAGGDLFDRIGHKKTYDERDARDLCRKMLDAMKFIHENNVAHCDMKPKNLLLRSEEDDSFIKLADFGFATRVYSPNSLTKQCGTPFFVAPEILMRTPYDQQADMWSVGVIIYLLLSGNLPFMGRSQRELFRAIVVGKYDFDDEQWNDVSGHAKDLIRGLLVTDPAKRLTAKEAMNSWWMRDRADMLSKRNLVASQRRLKTFNARMKLRSAMIAVNWVSQSRIMIRKLSAQKLQSPPEGPGVSASAGTAKSAAIKEETEEGLANEKSSSDFKVKLGKDGTSADAPGS